jgi:protein TonB
MTADGMTPRKPTALVVVCAAHAVLGWALLALGTERMPSSLRAWPEDALRLVAVRLVPPTPPAALVRTATRAPEPAAPSPPSPSLQPAARRTRPEAAPEPARAEVKPGHATPQAVATSVAAPASALQTEAPTAAAAAPTPAVPTPTAPAQPAQQTAAAAMPARAEAPPSVIARADRRQCPPAPHPAALRERGIEGAVLLRVKVDVQGRAADVQLLAGSGWRLFDEAALQQVRACRFIPAMQDGQAIDSWVEFPVRFALAG